MPSQNTEHSPDSLEETPPGISSAHSDRSSRQASRSAPPACPGGSRSGNPSRESTTDRCHLESPNRGVEGIALSYISPSRANAAVHKLRPLSPSTARSFLSTKAKETPRNRSVVRRPVRARGPLDCDPRAGLLSILLSIWPTVAHVRGGLTDVRGTRTLIGWSPKSDSWNP